MDDLEKSKVSAPPDGVVSKLAGNQLASYTSIRSTAGQHDSLRSRHQGIYSEPSRSQDGTSDPSTQQSSPWLGECIPSSDLFEDLPVHRQLCLPSTLALGA